MAWLNFEILVAFVGFSHHFEITAISPVLLRFKIHFSSYYFQVSSLSIIFPDLKKKKGKKLEKKC